MAQANSAAPARKLPGSLDTNRRLDRWLSINADGTVTLYTGKVEIGQGILTAVMQMTAEELDIDVSRIRLKAASTAFSPDEGITSGSRSIQESGLALRHVAAETRDLLLTRAAQKLGVTLESLTVADGVVSARGGGSVTYWELATPDMLAREATFDVTAKLPQEHVVVGTSLERVDIPNKVTGKPSFVQDMQPPGLLHGRISRPPGPKSTLKAIDLQEVEQMPGVVAVVRDGSFLGVVAEREEQAIRAERRLARIAQWNNGPELPANDPRHLLMTLEPKPGVPQMLETDAQGQIQQSWAPVILREPGCYIAHRAAVTVEQMGLAKAGVFYPTHGAIDANTFGLALQNPEASRAVTRYIGMHADETARRPAWLYVLAAGLGLMAAAAVRPLAWLMLALLAGAFGYPALLFLAGPAADARYIFPSSILCLLIMVVSLGLMLRPKGR